MQVFVSVFCENILELVLYEVKGLKVTEGKYWNRSNTSVAEVKRNLKMSIQMFSMNKGSSSTLVVDITLKVSCFENIAESYVM
jgi:hypothetical protein